MIYIEKIKIHPDKELEDRLTLLCNNARFIYNWMLNESIKLNDAKPFLYKIRKIRDLYRKCVRENTLYDKLGEIYDSNFHNILKNSPSQICDMECNAIAKAWNSEYLGQHPNFKLKRKSKLSFTLDAKTKYIFKYKDFTISTAKMDFKLDPTKVRFLKDSSQIKRITIVKEAYGWYICIMLDVPNEEFPQLEKTGKSVGIDWGIKYITSDNEGFQIKYSDLFNVKKYKLLENRLSDLQRILQTKRNKNPDWRKSKKYEILRSKIANIYSKLKFIRRNAMHHITKFYIEEYDIICIEDLKVKAMFKNHKLAKKLSESMFYTFKIMLQEKALMYGKEIRLKDPYLTSQTCSNCNTVLENKISLKNRIFKCNFCNFEIDRDVNAARNILAK